MLPVDIASRHNMLVILKELALNNRLGFWPIRVAINLQVTPLS